MWISYGRGDCEFLKPDSGWTGAHSAHPDDGPDDEFVLLPLALEEGDSGGIIGAELATVIIGGLMTSTILTLVVVPVVYRLLRRERRAPDDAPMPPTPSPVPAGGAE